MIDESSVKNSKQFTLKTATGDLVPVSGEVDLDIGIGNDRFRHKFIVAEITDDCIIGLDFMNQHKFKLDFDDKILRYKNIEVPLHVGSTSSVVARVILTETVTVPAYAESVVWAKLDGDPGGQKLFIVEPTEHDASRGIFVGSTLVDVTNNQMVPVKIVNLSEKNKRLKHGCELAKCDTVDLIINRSETVENEDESEKNEDSLINLFLEEIRTRIAIEDYDKAKLLIEEFSAAFSTGNNDYGRTDLIQHRINTGDADPIRQPPRRLPLAKQEEVIEMLAEMEKGRVIEKSKSPWSSPIVLVRKKDGSTRFCVDYRQLNDVTKKDSYPLPRIDDTLDILSGSKLFSTLDLKSGYWQVGINLEDREKTAFSTGNGLWQFTVMPFGLCNAPATFERLMENVLDGLHGKTCLVYLDDIIVFGKTFDEHLQNLKEVFERIQRAGMKLNLKKCSLFQDSVKYLGHIVSADGISTDPEKIEAVTNWPIPNNVHELRSFLGLCTYYRRFVVNFANVAKVLHQLTEKSQAFKWSTESDESFNRLKQLLCEAPILAYPEPGVPFILDTDASNVGIGGVLSQQIDGVERVVAYFSKVLSKPERNYCVTRRELLAVMMTVKHFHKYLYGQKFLIRTDHAALKWLLQFKNPEGQVARWIERLASYDYKIEHRKGRLHGNADALSRRPCKPECKPCSRAEEKEELNHICRIEVGSSPDWSHDRIREDQLLDRNIGQILSWKEIGNRPAWREVADQSSEIKSYLAQWDSLRLQNGILMRLWESADGNTSRLQMVVPRNRINEVLTEYHNGTSGGHLGVNKTLDKIRQWFYWLNCRTDVENWCRTCQICASVKGPKVKTRGKMQQYNVGAPFERIAVDVAGPFPETIHGNKYIMVVSDYFTKWPEAYAIPNQEAATVANELVSNWISRFGVPWELHSDQGRNFESKIFQELCRLLKLTKTRTTPLHPQSDGMVERFNQTLERNLAKMVDAKQEDWDSYIPLFLMSYRSAVHDTTGFTPAMILFGREIRVPAEIKFGTPKQESCTTNQYSCDLQQKMDDVHEIVRNKIKTASNKMKARYDLRANADVFVEDSLVWFYNPQRRQGKSPKLQPSWEGPYKVIKKINDVVYRIQKSPRAKMKVVHVDRLTRYHVPAGEGLNSIRDE